MEESTILFRGHEVSLLLNNITKRLLLDQVYDIIKVRILDKTVQKIGSSDDKFWKTPVFCTTFSEGERYWLLMTRIADSPKMILIHKYIKKGYPYPKMFDITDIVSSEYDKFFDMTLMECEIVGGSITTVTNMKPLTILISDVLIQSGKDMRPVNPCVRFSNIQSILKSYVFFDRAKIQIQTKHFFHKKNMRKLNSFISSLDYKVLGLLFYSCENGETPSPRLWMDYGQELYRKST